ncbi:MAG: Gfo/Idh/MocA family oxidoreductase [Planctomycetaceae bacterium]
MARIRWGIAGCGDVVRKRVAEAIRQDANSELVAACRRDSQQLRAFCDTFQVPRAYTAVEDLLADAEIDAVYIATPVACHRPQTLMAAEQGKHVLVEKPMGMSAAECAEMVAACCSADVRLGVAYYRRFYPLVERIKQLLADGAVGQPLSVSAVTSTPCDMSPGAEGYWRVLPEQGGGGALMDIGSHRLNLFLDLFGEMRDVRALCGTLHADYAADNLVSLIVEFRSGVHGVLQCYFGSRVDPDEFAIQGTHGRIVARPLNGSRLEIQTCDGTRTETHDPPVNLNGPLIEDFSLAILERRLPRVSGDEGLLVNQVMERAYASAARSPAR